MVPNADAYFEETKHGRSSTWDWLAGFWLIIIGWIIAQLVFTSPIVDIARGVDPEKTAAVDQVMMSMFDEQTLLKIGLLSLLFVVSSIAGFLFYVIARHNEGSARKILGGIAGVGMVVSIISLGYLFPMMSDAEANAAFMELLFISPVNYALMLAVFPGTLIGVFLVQKFVHMRSLTSLHTAMANINWKRIFSAIIITWAVYAVVQAFAYSLGLSTLEFTYDPAKFFIYGLVTLLFIPLQSGTEEIVFRGYLNQAFGHFIRNKWVVFIITSALFAAMHLSNPEAVSGAEEGGFEHLLVMSQYFLFGFMLSVVVYFEGGLEAAIGVHAANNMFAALFINYEGSVLSTPSLFISTPNSSIDIPMFLFTLALITYILYRTRSPIEPAGRSENPVSAS
jgi:membrane protease YdiL (CAAX protease family)